MIGSLPVDMLTTSNFHIHTANDNVSEEKLAVYDNITQNNSRLLVWNFNIWFLATLPQQDILRTDASYSNV